jgi:hypothetical protein
VASCFYRCGDEPHYPLKGRLVESVRRPDALEKVNVIPIGNRVRTLWLSSSLCG